MRFLFGLLMNFGAALAVAAPIATLPGLTAVRIYENSSGVVTYSFAPNDPILSTRLPGLLNTGNADATSIAPEYYDFFYSDAAGNVDPLGSYLTVEARYINTGGTGLNLTEAELVFGGTTQFANVVTSFLAGPGYVLGSELNAVDGSFATTTLMGHNPGGMPDRLRVTVGFQASAVETPETSTWSMMGAGLSVLSYLTRKRRLL